jgi:hypothetical protein
MQVLAVPVQNFADPGPDFPTPSRWIGQAASQDKSVRTHGFAWIE